MKASLIHRETLSLKSRTVTRPCNSVVKYLPSMYEALGFHPYHYKNKNKKTFFK